MVDVGVGRAYGGVCVGGCGGRLREGRGLISVDVGGAGRERGSGGRRRGQCR